MYQMVYSYYGFALMVITGGFPTVLAMFTAKNAVRGWIWFKIISTVMVIFGGVISFCSFWFAFDIASMIGNPKLDFAIRCLAPALFAVPLLSLLRGYLQGLENYGMIALSELIEQAVRVASMLLLVVLFLHKGSPIAVGGGILGTFIGALIAFSTLILFFLLSSRKENEVSERGASSMKTIRTVLLWFFHSSLIIAFTRMLVPLSDFFDAIVIPNRLQAAGHTASEATAMFGVITGMAVIVVYMPTIVTAALSHTVTIKIVTDWREKRNKHFYLRMRKALELGWVWGGTAGLFLLVYGAELSRLIFGTDEAAAPIRYLAIIPLLVGLRELTTSMLWAQDRKKVPLTGLIVGICVSALSHYFLVRIPGFGYAGAAIGILALEFVAVVWNICALRQGWTYLFRLKLLLLDVISIAGALLLVTTFFIVPIINDLSETIKTYLGMIMFSAAAGLYILLRFFYYNIRYRN